MIVLGTHHEDWIPAMRAAVLMLSNRAGQQIDDLGPIAGSTSEFELKLLDGSRLTLAISANGVEITLLGADGKTLVHISDETIAIDEDDRSNITLDAHWVDSVINRWVELAADYQNIDPISDKTAQLAAFDDGTRAQILEIYQYAANHMKRSGHTQELDLHLTLPTEYWTANFACTDAGKQHFVIAEDPQFTAMLEALPEACEMIGREGEGARIDIVPLYLTPIRVG